MPHRRKTDEPGPFAQLLFDWMWSQRPPLSIGQLATRLGLSKQTVYNWTGRDELPSSTAIPLISERLGIPVDALLNAARQTEDARYRARGQLIPTAPAPKQVRPQPATPPDPWQDMIDRVEQDPRFDAATRAAMIQHIREVRAGYDPMARHIAAEFAEPAAEEPAPESRPRRRSSQPPSRSTSTAPNRQRSGGTLRQSPR
jgi:hypothetical protein